MQEGESKIKGMLADPKAMRMTREDNHKQLKTPFIIYADFEALTTKVEGPELHPAKSNTQRTQHHEACSYCYIVVRCDG